jgi:hypothetical protein
MQQFRLKRHGVLIYRRPFNCPLYVVINDTHGPILTFFSNTRVQCLVLSWPNYKTNGVIKLCRPDRISSTRHALVCCSVSLVTKSLSFLYVGYSLLLGRKERRKLSSVSVFDAFEQKMVIDLPSLNLHVVFVVVVFFWKWIERKRIGNWKWNRYWREKRNLCQLCLRP